MTRKGINADILSKNYEELNTEGRDTLLRIGEKVFNVKNFVNNKIFIFKRQTGEN